MYQASLPGDGFPCIKEVDIDFDIKDSILRCYSDETRDRAMKKFATMLNAVKETPLLRLTIETIQASFFFPLLLKALVNIYIYIYMCSMSLMYNFSASVHSQTLLVN